MKPDFTTGTVLHYDCCTNEALHYLNALIT
jgi:hypothetical protein